MIYLVGVDHHIQYTNAQSGSYKRQRIQEFQRFLAEQSRQLGIEVLAEEFSEDALTLNRATSCTVCEVATRLQVAHRFCDPGRQERAERGIDGADPDEGKKREKVWLEKLADVREQAVLFICGDTHIKSFQALLKGAGWQVVILSTEWGRDIQGAEAMDL